MWKRKEEDEVTPAVKPTYTSPPPEAPRSAPPVASPSSLTAAGSELAHIGKSVVVKGELSGSEDLSIDGEVEGTVELHGHNLLIGPNGRVKGHLHAKQVVVHGKVDGNITASERAELRRTAILVGDIATPRIAIEEGAFFKGGIEVSQSKSAAGQTKAEGSIQNKKEPAFVSASTPATSAGASPAANTSSSPQGSMFSPGPKKP